MSTNSLSTILEQIVNVCCTETKRIKYRISTSYAVDLFLSILHIYT